jgi:hypothetical protein
MNWIHIEIDGIKRPYIYDDVCNLSSQVFRSWASEAKGSQKLSSRLRSSKESRGSEAEKLMFSGSEHSESDHSDSDHAGSERAGSERWNTDR